MRYRDSVAAGLRLILLGAFGAAALLMSNSTLDVKAPTPEPDLAADQAAALIAEHNCSVQGYGPGVLPSGSIVDTGTGPRYASSKPGLEIAFEGREGIVYAFCL